jgi:hypothetical protein
MEIVALRLSVGGFAHDEAGRGPRTDIMQLAMSDGLQRETQGNESGRSM